MGLFGKRRHKEPDATITKKIALFSEGKHKNPRQEKLWRAAWMKKHGKSFVEASAKPVFKSKKNPETRDQKTARLDKDRPEPKAEPAVRSKVENAAAKPAVSKVVKAAQKKMPAVPKPAAQPAHIPQAVSSGFDAVASSEAELIKILAGLQNATSPKTVGYSQPLKQMRLDGLKFSHRVTVSPIGDYTDNGIPSCSTYVEGMATFHDTVNLHLKRNDFRAPTGSKCSKGHVRAINATNLFMEDNFFRGRPFVFDTKNPTSGTTSAGIELDGGSGHALVGNFGMFYADGPYRLAGKLTDLLEQSNWALYSGGDDVSITKTCEMLRCALRYTYSDPLHSKVYDNHNDFRQGNFDKPNRYTGGSKLDEFLHEYIFLTRQRWAYDPTEKHSVGLQGFFYGRSNRNNPNATNVMQHSVFANGQSCGIDFPNGANKNDWVNDCSFIDPVTSPEKRVNSPYSTVRDVDGSFARNFMVTKNAGGAAAQSANGGMEFAINDDHSKLSEHYNTIPSYDSDIFDMLPKKGSPQHPQSANPVGAHKLYGLILNGDPLMVHSKRGWPMSQSWQRVQDPKHRLSSAVKGFNLIGDNA